MAFIEQLDQHLMERSQQEEFSGVVKIEQGRLRFPLMGDKNSGQAYWVNLCDG